MGEGNRHFNTTDEPLRIARVLRRWFRGRGLDIGSDNGRHLYLMPKGSVGLDSFDTFFPEFQERGYRGVQCDLNKGKLPFADGHFDFIFFSHTLEHLEMPNRILEEVHRVLKPNKTLVIGVPNAWCVHTNFYSKRWPIHINVYDGTVLRKLLTKNSFRVKRRYCNFPTKSYLSFLLFNYTPLKYVWDDVFFVCEKQEKPFVAPEERIRRGREAVDALRHEQQGL